MELRIILVLFVICSHTWSQKVFHFVNQSKTFDEAQRYCRDNYIDLVTLSDQTNTEELFALENFTYTESAWIGLKKTHSKQWHWALADEKLYKEGEAGYRNWAANEEEVVIEYEDCGAMGADRQFYDTYCFPTRYFLCYDENLPLKGTATQSSTYNAQSAGRAIDGAKDFSRSLSSCAITRSEENPWWRLDLQASYRVNIIVVTYREDCCLDRWKGVEIHFGNSLQDDGNDNPRCAAMSVDPTTSSVTYSCADLEEGRYVNILLLAWWNYLPVCEVEVYESDSTRRLFMKIAFNSTANLTDPTVTDQVLKELTSALAVRGINNVTLSWSQTPKEEVIQRQVENGESVPTTSHPE
ncbi:Fucolectin-5 [Anabarilius grahami]|uniref:Fucolectin-5 n=1 Tax=Anabarilius grahami TaxID=495550 RepID=A0A3N0Y2R2_ANAGA|nr:Fucolectin-5 [Anabarilius grahami]